jgi:hypothetical protein
MTSSIVFPQFFLPLTSIKLGRFVTSVIHPHQDYHDAPLPNPPTPIITLRENYTGLQNEGTRSNLSTALTSLLSSAFSKRAHGRTRITTTQVKTYTLENSSQLFQEALEIESTRKWIEKAIDDGDDIYFIVGFHTVVDARIVIESSKAQDIGGRVGIPVDLSLAAVGAIVPFGHLVSPHVDGQYANADSLYAQFLAPGEQICAFQYRKVSFRWLSSKQADTASLSKCPRWRKTDSWRTMQPQEEDTEDTVEVEMEPAELYDEDWDKEETTEGELVLMHVS